MSPGHGDRSGALADGRAAVGGSPPPPPVVGGVETSQAVVAGAAVRVLEAAVEDAGAFIGPDGGLDIRRESDRRIDLASLEDADEAVEGWPVETLASARDRLVRTSLSGRIEEIAAGRER